MELEQRSELIQNRLYFSGKADHFNSLSNGTEADLVKQLVTIATIMLLFTSPIFSSDSIKSNTGVLPLLLTSWVCAVTSIGFGTWQLFLNRALFTKHAKFNNGMELEFAKTAKGDQTPETMLSEINKLQNKYKYKIDGPIFALVWQIVFLAISVVFTFLSGLFLFSQFIG